MDNLTTALVFFSLEFGFGFIGFFVGKLLWEKIDDNKHKKQTVTVSITTVTQHKAIKRPIRI